MKMTNRFFSARLAVFAAAFAATAFVMSAVMPQPAAAQWGSGTTGHDVRPRLSTAEEVAITQHVLSGDPPSAREWASHTREYKEANDFDREAVLDAKRREYVAKFNMFSKPETLVIGANIQLSAYSEANKGFIVESFDDQTFFSYNFAGQKYAIVIPKLMEYQWLSVDPETAKKISRSTGAYQGRVRLVMEIEPKFADKNPMELRGDTYRLLAGEVISFSLYGLTSDRTLWARSGSGHAERTRGDMINLFDRK